MQGTRKRTLSAGGPQEIVFGDEPTAKSKKGSGGRKKKASEPAPVSDNFVAKPRSTKLGGLAVSALVETDLWYQQLNDDEEEVALVDALNECLYPAWPLYLSEPFDETHEAIPIIQQCLPIFDAMFEQLSRTEVNKFKQLVSSTEGISGTQTLHINWQKFMQDCPDLNDMLRYRPTLMLACLGIAGCQSMYSLYHRLTDELVPRTKRTVRVMNYGPITPLRDIKANYMGQLISLRGTVVRVSTVLPIVKQVTFICMNCRALITEVFLDGKVRTPSKCSVYGCKGKTFIPDRGMFHATKTVDWQRVRIQEKLTDDQVDSGRVPRSMDCELSEDLVDSFLPGDVVCITGIIKVLSEEEGSKAARTGTQMYRLYVDTHSFVKASASLSEEDNPDTAFTKDGIDFSKKDLYGIREVLEPGVDTFKLLVNSLCPQIFGHEMVKAGLLLVLMGGRQRIDGKDSTGVSTRSNPHILVVGDPGLGKSQLLSATCRAAPRGVYVCGNSATSSGLTVTMKKDPDSGELCLEAGALVLGDQGVCCIDEFDKMTEHYSLLEAMEQQSISVAKAGMVCNLPARTSIIAAANPIGGHYNKAKSVSDNLRLNSALLSRFDLVFILLDSPDESKDRFLSDHVMKMHSGTKIFQPDPSGRPSSSHHQFVVQNQEDEPDEPDEPKALADRLKLGQGEEMDMIPASLLRKYIAYARRYTQPRLSTAAANVLKAFYLTLRRNYRSPDSTPITTRQLESMIRLSEARARCELRNEILESDALEVVEIMKFSLWETYQHESVTRQGGNSHGGVRGTQGGSKPSKHAEPKRFIAELQKVAFASSNTHFSYDNLYQIATQLRLQYDRFEDLIETLNGQGYLLKRGNKMYKLSTV